jgi:hypothetical protein
MALSRASVTTPTVDSKPRRCDRKDFSPIKKQNVATTRSVDASTHHTIRFSPSPRDHFASPVGNAALAVACSKFPKKLRKKRFWLSTAIESPVAADDGATRHDRSRLPVAIYTNCKR